MPVDQLFSDLAKLAQQIDVGNFLGTLVLRLSVPLVAPIYLCRTVTFKFIYVCGMSRGSAQVSATVYLGTSFLLMLEVATVKRPWSAAVR